MTQVVVIEPFTIAGSTTPAIGSTVDIDASLAALMVTARKARYVTAPGLSESNPGGGLTAAQVAAVQSLVSTPGIPGAAALSATDYLPSPVSWPAPSSAAVSTTAVVSQVSSVVTPTTPLAARIVWLDLEPPVGATTDAAGYAVGAKTINLASAGTGAFYAGDVVTIAGQSNEYTLLAGDSNVSNGGTITLAGTGVLVAISAAATAITLVRRGPLAHIAANCDNDLEGLLRSQDPATRDASVRLGEAIVLRSDTPLSILHLSASTSVLINASRIETVFGS